MFFENILPGKQRGVVDKVPENLWGRSPGKGRDAVPDLGQITYQNNGTKKAISFHAKDTDLRVPPEVGDKVCFLKFVCIAQLDMK